MNLPPLVFAAVGIDHRHSYDQVQSLLDVGGACVGWWTEGTPKTLEGFVRRFPQIPRVDDRRRLLEDRACSSSPARRYHAIARVMRSRRCARARTSCPTSRASPRPSSWQRASRAAGDEAHLDGELHRALRGAGVTRALDLVRDGAIGDVVQTVGLGPHRENRALRDPWFYDKSKYGGILVDIASHQIDQFLVFAGATDAEITLARRRTSRTRTTRLRGLRRDRAGRGTGECLHPRRLVHARRPPDWGDGRLFIYGTKGTIELRKYVDPDGRPGKDHLFLIDGKTARHIDCSDAGLPYYANLHRDIVERTETAMPQAHTYKVCELALAAQRGRNAATPPLSPPTQPPRRRRDAIRLV